MQKTARVHPCTLANSLALQTIDSAKLFLHWSDRILRGLGDPKLDDCFRLDLDRLAGLRIPSQASFSFRFNKLTNSWDSKLTIFFWFL